MSERGWPPYRNYLITTEFEKNLNHLTVIERQIELLNALGLQAEAATLWTKSGEIRKTLEQQITEACAKNAALNQLVSEAKRQGYDDGEIAQSIFKTTLLIRSGLSPAHLEKRLIQYRTSSALNETAAKNTFHAQFSKDIQQADKLANALKALPLKETEKTETANAVLDCIGLRRGKSRDNRFMQWLERHFPRPTKYITIRGYREIVLPIEEMRRHPRP